MINKIKSLVSDTMIYGVFQVLGRFLSFLLTPLYTNYLTKVELAETTYIYSIIAFLNIIFSFGIESSFFRFYDKDDPARSKKVFTNAFLIIASIAATVALLVILTADTFADSFVELRNPALVIRLAILIPLCDSLIFIPYAYLRMTRRAKKFATTRFVLIVIAVINNIIFVVIMRTGAIGVIVSQLLAAIVGIAIVGKDIKNNFIGKVDFKMIKEMIVFGLPTLPANISAMILQVADRPFLKALASTTDLAIYSVNYRLAIPMMLVVTVFDYAWKPFYLSKYKEEGSSEMFARVFTYYTLACSMVFLATSLFIEYVVKMPFIGGKFIAADYWVGLGVVPIILVAFFINGTQSHFAAGFLITKNTKYVGISVGLGAAVSLLLNWLLIPILSYWGSAIAIVTGYVFGAGTLFFFQRKFYPIKYEWKRIFTIAAAAAIIYFAAMSITRDIAPLAGVAIKLLFIIIYFVLLYFLKFFTVNEISGIKRLFKIK